MMKMMEMITPALAALLLWTSSLGLLAQDAPAPPDAPPGIIPLPKEEPARAEEPPAPKEEPTPTEEAPAPVEEPAPAEATEEPTPAEEPPAPAETPAPTEESPTPVEEATPDAEPASDQPAATADAPAETPETEPAPEEPAPPALTAQQREFGPIGPNQRYLNLPVKTDGPKTRMTISSGGQAVRDFDIELSDSPDLWVFVDLTAFAGKKISVSAQSLLESSNAMNMLELGETIKNADQLYQEPLRPQFHFSTKRGWINDPNGLVYQNGEYHMFYQHNPYGWKWGNMHWGHAISRDLVHWEQQPIALYPKAHGDWAFSGGALVDEDNTSGFKNGKEDVLVAFYTSTGRGECVVYSNDRGRTWTEFEGNPVVKHEGRDPKVIWHEMSRKWVMAVYQEHEGGQYIAFYSSPNLKAWNFESRIEGFYECPEIFEATVNLDPTNPKWVLYGADGDYLLGSFDGKTFTPDGDKIKGNYGNCFYASQMYSNLPKYDQRHIQVAWGKVDMPNMPFNQQMLFPTELRLKKTADGPRLHTTPVREIARLYQSSETKEGIAASGSIATGDLLDIEATMDVSQAQKVTFNVRGTPVTFDIAGGELSCLDQTAPLTAKDGKVQIRLLVDRTTIEIYANHGRVYMPIGVLLDASNKGVSVLASGSATFQRLDVRGLKSIWTK